MSYLLQINTSVWCSMDNVRQCLLYLSDWQLILDFSHLLLGALHVKLCLHVKVEYHANENPSKNSEKDSICWSTVNVSNNKK